MKKVYHSGNRGGQNLDTEREASLTWSDHEKLDQGLGTKDGL